MGHLFSRKKSRVTEQDKAVLQLKQQRDKLKLYQKRIESNLGRDREIAKSLIQNGRKERALSLLRKKRFQEEQLNKLDKMLENIEKMTSDIEFKQVEMNVLDGLKAGNAALKKLHQLISVDEIERIMDETKDGIEKQQEIDELLHGALTSEDEEAVLDELNALISGAEETEVINKLDELPEVPELPETEEEEEEQAEEEEAVSEKVPKKRKRKEKIAIEA
ncbi:Charged multivesicular body protein 6-A [Polyplax serrata]|uniref:Charged multivesicular body protein 6-A n=1 Tax=Polyplax serrata TaxID=468196 RepID=A0AAN8S2Z2_POLSC